MDATPTNPTESNDDVVIRLPTVEGVMRRIFPDDAVDHMRNARRESLLAMRAIIDNNLQHLDQTRGKATSRRIEIKVE